MYFLQEAGQPLHLSYGKARYGPYAENLNHVLQALEGHYLRVYGDRTQEVLELTLSPSCPAPRTQASDGWLIILTKLPNGSTG
jgi:hypothetical protein